MPKPSAIAIGAHPDDIEFAMAGTLLQLQAVGWEIHYFNLSSGNLGSVKLNAAQATRTRAREAKAAAKILGAKYHASICRDLEIIYDVPTLRKVAAVIRKSKASVVLTHSPVDYMEDHTNTCRLAVAVAFAHGMPNFKSVPAAKPFAHNVTVYHAMPHSLRDPLRQRVMAGAFVNTTAVRARQVEALAAHQSQQDWLDVSQGMNSYIKAGEEVSRLLGRLSKKFKFAEGWRRHLHFGFSSEELDPLADALGKNYLINQKYERALEKEK
jgi:LmbE family N-acetylglucosaminyl deacetylase